MKLYYNDKNITDMVSISWAELHDFAGGSADYVKLCFSDTEKMWPGWEPARGDIVRVVADQFDTGKLFIHSADYPGGVCTIMAVSVPRDAYRPRSKVWRSVSLMEIAGDVAQRCGLTLSTYSVTNQQYASIAQIQQADLPFLTSAAALEGIAVKASNGKLILFGEAAMEALEPMKTIHMSEAEPDCAFSEGDGYRSVEVRYQPFGGSMVSGKAEDGAVTGSQPIMRIKATTDAEAMRFATGMLRQKNKNRIIAQMTLRAITDVAAGSAVTLKDFGEKDGNWFCSEVLHDPVNGKSKLVLRKPLTY